MIKLFRKIRQNLLNEGKTTKYFKYAIGEIILVVIGILIALQINNWNETRKDEIEEKAILKSLVENLNIAKKQSELLILEEEHLKLGLISILGINKIQHKNATLKISDSLFKSAVWDLQSDQPTFNAYNNLKNTNKLSLIKDKSINEKFTDLDFNLNKLNDILEDRLQVHQIRIDDILENDVNFIPLVKYNIADINIENELPNTYKEIVEDKRIRNLLGMKLSFTQDVINRRKNVDQAIKELLSLITFKLNKT